MFPEMQRKIFFFLYFFLNSGRRRKFHNLTMKVKEFLSPTTPANAGLLYTTECSPFKITLPGAETVNLMDIFRFLLLFQFILINFKLFFCNFGFS